MILLPLQIQARGLNDMQHHLQGLIQDCQFEASVGALTITGLSADSREIKPGYLFFALAGSHLDGTRFIADAIARGAVAIVAHAPLQASVPVIVSDHPRRTLALAAAKFYDLQPKVIAAVTGTNGKTSVAAFVREIWEHMGFRAASLGTVGIVGPDGVKPLHHTTPDPVVLHQAIDELARDHVSHLALEASSHGLDQARLDGVRLSAGAFTNITRDHLDYHQNFEAYFAAKMRLFSELLPEGAGGVIHADGEYAQAVEAIAKARQLRLMRVGRKGQEIKLLELSAAGLGQNMHISYQGVEHKISLPLAGAFQADNALVAAGLVIACGGEAKHVFWALESLKGASGRLELVGRTSHGAPIYVDYAHTPDALENALQALRPLVTGKLIVVFGCGGDRDRGKRPLMGAVAQSHADHIIITDDNPRNEDAGLIRQEILAAAPSAIEIGDREAAIFSAVQNLSADDVLLVAGKGHETGQIIGHEVRAFRDHDVVQKAIGALQ